MSVYMDSGNYTYELIKRGLDTASLRGKAIANNMANVNTKNYKKYVVSFEDSLRDVSEDIKKTGRVKLNNSSIGSIKLEKDEKTSMNINGNNIDIEIEKTNQAANTLLYNALISKVNSKLSMKSYIITGGK